ncbi:hypothetical protein RJ641_010497 [Dillenia turbinata]|uniref:Retrovirus-related Pol polyprotein from transposon TNT 1-94 n=1 Tax=Dillenia turbinata TaxID=194707 RepID=A0AAN8VBL7_9MAGN
MASENFIKPSILHFDGHYGHWSMLMENFLKSKEYWHASRIEEPTAGTIMTDAQRAELEGQRLKDLKAKNYLFQAIDRLILETILNKDTSKQIWDSMKKKYQGSTGAKRQQLQGLRTEFENLLMKSEESIANYFSRTMAIVEAEAEDTMIKTYSENLKTTKLMIVKEEEEVKAITTPSLTD